MSGSARVLAAMVAAFVAAFWLLRSSSAFLALERQAPFAAELAREHGLTAPEVLAIGELVDGHRDRDRWRRAVGVFAQRTALGDQLAAMAAAGHAGIVDAAFARAQGDRGQAWQAVRQQPEALAAGRFAAMRDRFAARSRD